MRKTKILAVSLLLIPILLILPMIMITPPIVLTNIENKRSNEELNISTESGGGYLMSTDATYSWIEIQSTGNLMMISNTHDSSEEISFISNGWSFPFYKTLYDTIIVSSNGWMSFTNLGDTQWFCYNIPSYEIENFDCVALLCASMGPRYSGNIYYQFFGTGPNRYLVIEYNQIYGYEQELVGDFEVIFYENGTIKFQYKLIHDIQLFYPIIGLDHGDLTNFNRYDAKLPLRSKTIEFTFNKMIEIEYELNFKVGDMFSWLVLEVDQTKMDQFFGITWETDFGLYPNMLINEKTQINVSLIIENSTHWKINYTTWDWIKKNDTFSSSYDSNDSILYQKEPLNYTIPHILKNHYPFLMPNFTSLYLIRANLEDDYYNNIILYSFGNIILESFLDINSYGVAIEGFYSSSGILEELKVSYVDYENETSIEEIIFLMVRYIEGPKPFYVGVNEGNIYEYGTFYSIKNAPPGFSQEYFENFPDRLRFSVDFIGGEDSELNRSLVIITLSARINNSWIKLMIFESYLYRNTEDIELPYYGQYVESITVNWESYALIIENSYNRGISGMYTVTPLEDGIRVYTEVYLPVGFNLEDIITYNTSIGVMNVFSERYNGREFLTYRLNDFNYKIKEGGGAIPNVNIILLTFIMLTGIISIAWQIRRKITLK